MELSPDTILSLYLIEADRAEAEFDVAFNTFCVAMYDGQVTESVSEPFGSSLKKYFTNLITAVRNFINKMKNYFSKTAREFSYINTLNGMEKKIRAAKAEGKHKVTMPNYQKIRSEYDAMARDLKKYGKKFTKMNYSSTIDIDNDLDDFSKAMDKWDKRMDKVLKETVTIDIDDALRFVENEKRGYTHIFDSLNDCIETIDELRHVAEETSKRVGSLGSDVIPKHVNLLRKVANAISRRITNFASKTIAVTVLMFA
jgi:hypothetical protein